MARIDEKAPVAGSTFIKHEGGGAFANWTGAGMCCCGGGCESIAQECCGPWFAAFARRVKQDGGTLDTFTPTRLAALAAQAVTVKAKTLGALPPKAKLASPPKAAPLKPPQAKRAAPPRGQRVRALRTTGQLLQGAEGSPPEQDGVGKTGPPLKDGAAPTDGDAPENGAEPKEGKDGGGPQAEAGGAEVQVPPPVKAKAVKAGGGGEEEEEEEEEEEAFNARKLWKVTRKTIKKDGKVLSRPQTLNLN